MQWNWAGALFFIFLCLSIGGVTLWDILRPDTGRKGFLPIATTRGDRLFIGIMSSIGLLMVWLAMVGNQALGVACFVLAIWNLVLALRG
ncbi:MAG: hypothetical protein KJT03_19785 [Verrucomicrobiae bacterium]|nr:hypothetical protein [Verrucomicrobiae bacterium]